jgi:hypothetical protein
MADEQSTLKDFGIDYPEEWSRRERPVKTSYTRDEMRAAFMDGVNFGLHRWVGYPEQEAREAFLISLEGFQAEFRANQQKRQLAKQRRILKSKKKS